MITEDKTPWIPDSGASNHMTSCSSLFSTYTSCAGNLKVKIADGSLAIVAGKWSIILSRNMTLKFMLQVPFLTCNPLSISKLTHDQNCVAKFGSYSSQFKELVSGKMIGNAKECGGIYYLKTQVDKIQFANLFLFLYVKIMSCCGI